MDLIDLQQNSPEWLSWRRDKLGASDAPIIMGESPFKTPFALWKQKTGLEPASYISEAMKHGAKSESIAREMFEDMMGEKFPSACVQSTENLFAIASLDGLSSNNEIVEIKCPYSKDRFFEMVLSDKVPLEYRAQLQHQMMVTGLSFVHFFAYYEGETFYKKVERDDKYIEKLLEEEKKFYDLLVSGEAPDKSTKDYNENVTPEWMEIASELKVLQIKRKAIEDEEKVLKEKLISMADEQPTRGGGVTVYSTTRKGSLNLKDLEKDLEISGIDLDSYRRADIKSWCVKVS